MVDQNREEELAQVAQALNQSPFYRYLGMRIVKIGEGFSEVHIDLSPEFKNIWGTIHGGVAASLLDTTCGSSLYSALEKNEGAVTIDLRVNFIAGGKVGKMIGKGQFVHRTRTLAWSQADAFNSEGHLIARAQAIHKVIKREWGK
jgi:uncharacterized protein (TIGR00369 family)